MCLTCGQGTGNWCDECQLAGRTFVFNFGGGDQPLVGMPYCTVCENAPFDCRACHGM